MRVLHVLLGAAAGLSLTGAAWAGAATVAADLPTYAEDVAPILNQRCVRCHRPGQVAPMALRTYDEVRPWAKSIGRKVAERTMPPWHATGGSASFTNDRSLEDHEVETIVRWVKAGAPPGDLTVAPSPPEFTDGEWKLGEPDFVVTLEEVTVPGGGPDQFHDLIGRVMLPEDRWIRAVEILPGNPKVVHHVIVYTLKGFDVDPQDGWLGAWAAGTQPMVFPEGTGRLLKKGSNVIGDMHYHPVEEEQTDVTRIGLYFADAAKVEKELTNIWVMNRSFEIPAGAESHEVRASYTFWQDGKIMTLTPHMHYRGKDFKFVITYPDGQQLVPLEVGDWDFNWQTVYYLDEPISVVEGTQVECIAHYDNSPGNLDNPDPTKDVRFGPESYDEMMIGFLDFIVDQGVAPLEPAEIRTRKIEELARKYPGQVYAVSGKPEEKRSEPNSYAPLYLPRSGDGAFYVIWNGNLSASRVYGIEWSGSSFEAKVESPWGDFRLTGEVHEDGAIETVLYLPEERTMPWTGRLAES